MSLKCLKLVIETISRFIDQFEQIDIWFQIDVKSVIRITVKQGNCT